MNEWLKDRNGWESPDDKPIKRLGGWQCWADIYDDHVIKTPKSRKEIQEKIKQAEKKQRRQRQEIFDVEDEILEKRDDLIDALEKRLNQKTTTEELFTIRWQVV